jgi:hypothetical protein
VSGKLFDNAVLEAARSNAADFGRVYFVFRALRPPDVDLLSAVLLGEAFTERILAALHGEVEREEERQRRERVLERALGMVKLYLVKTQVLLVRVGERARTPLLAGALINRPLSALPC